MNTNQDPKDSDILVKPSEAWKSTGDRNTIPTTETKRFDHHLIDEDLGLEDKYGRRLDPKEELKNFGPSPSGSTKTKPSE